MNLFKKKANTESAIRIISTGNSYAGGRTFYVLRAPTANDITENNLIALFGNNYADKILDGSAIYAGPGDDITIKFWNEADEEFK